MSSRVVDHGEAEFNSGGSMVSLVGIVIEMLSQQDCNDKEGGLSKRGPIGPVLTRLKHLV